MRVGFIKNDNLTGGYIVSEREKGDFIGHFHCVATDLKSSGVLNLRNSEYDECNSSDALAIYEADLEDGTVSYSGYCFSCNQCFSNDQLAKSSLAKSLGMQDNGVVSDRQNFVRKEKQPPLEKSQVSYLIKTIGYYDKVFRGIRPEILKFFGHLCKRDSFGEPSAFYYPETCGDGWPTGYKIRYLPKHFSKVGKTGVSSDFAGQVKFKDYKQHRTILVVGGEVDLCSAYQMLLDYQKTKDYAPIAVVSPTTGESSAIKQVKSQYDFLDSFDSIILGLDNDSVGVEAMLSIAEILPKDKVKIAYWTGKDPNNMLTSGQERQFISDFYNAKPFVYDGIITSIDADLTIEEELLQPKMTLPPFMSALQKKMAGGVPLGYAVNWISESGIGKTTLINEAIRHWIYTSPYRVGILSLELSAAQYMIAMLSREVGYKINLIENPQDAVDFVRKPEVVAARQHLSKDEYGRDRFVLLDERDGDLETVKRQCERLISKYDCQVIIIDPIQDLFEGVDSLEQNKFLKWMKGVMKRGVTFHNVCHVRKGSTSTDRNGKRIRRELTEDDVFGISAIVKSGGANIFMSRDKYAEDDVEKNTTNITVGKCRWTGITGKVGDWYYDNKTHTMHDKETYFSSNPSLPLTEDELSFSNQMINLQGETKEDAGSIF